MFLLLVVNDGSIWTCAWYGSKTQFNKVFLLTERKDCDHYSTSERSTPGTWSAPSSLSHHLSLLLSLESHLGKHTQVEELYRSRPCPPNHVETCFPSLPFPYKQKIHHPDHPGKRCPEQFLITYLLQGIFRGPVDVHMGVSLNKNGAYSPSEEEEILLLHQLLCGKKTTVSYLSILTCGTPHCYLKRKADRIQWAGTCISQETQFFPNSFKCSKKSCSNGLSSGKIYLRVSWISKE